MTKQHKLRVLQACVFSKLLYGLESCVLLKANQARLDGIQAKCIRKIWKIQPAFLSRISNACVRSEANARLLSSLLLERQLKYYGKLARAPPQSLPRAMVFQPGQNLLMPRDWRSPKNRGRPRLQWTAYTGLAILVPFRGMCGRFWLGMCARCAGMCAACAPHVRMFWTSERYDLVACSHVRPCAGHVL